MASKAAYKQKKYRQLKKEFVQEKEKYSNETNKSSAHYEDQPGPSGILNTKSRTSDESSSDHEGLIPASIYLWEEMSGLSNSFEHLSISSTDSNNTGQNLSNNTMIEDVFSNDQNIQPNIELKAKLTNWTLRNLSTLRLNVVSELLLILREEGYNLPKTAQTLLGTQHRRKLQVMQSAKGSSGEFIYLGIKNGLQKIISPQVYTEDKISILIHVDGMQIYKSSKIVVWPIVIKLYHENYISHPFVVGIFCGDSKPHCVQEFLNDFITEANDLIQCGVVLKNKLYSFEILGIVADSPARAFLKCCKAPGGYYACERCETSGISVGEGRKQVRVYPDMNCTKRTKLSFETRKQPEHHHVDPSPLLEIHNFDPVKMMILDGMHLFYCCIMKWLLEKWILSGSPHRLKAASIKRMQELLTAITPDVPIEFQRKKFDIYSLSNWKATQYRFFLHYCGPVILRNILPQNYYQHFLLLYTACRILNNKDLITTDVDLAEEFLRRFFYLLPSIYGEKSQVLSMHNVIHVSDDVRHFKVPVSEISAFWGENYIGIFKKLIKSPLKPLTQIVNRLAELEKSDSVKVQRRAVVQDLVINESSGIFQYHQKEFAVVSRVTLYGVILKPSHPNNTVQLKNGNIFSITRILVEKKKSKELENIYITGYEESSSQSFFTIPTHSENIGVNKINEFSKREVIILASNIKYKCVLLNKIDDIQCAISLLHAYHLHN